MPPISRSSLTQIWLVEILRLQEAHWGPLDDAHALRQARMGPPKVDARIFIRARYLAQTTGLDRRLTQFRHGAAWAGALLAALAVLAGTLAAAGALGRGGAPVNIIWALGALLGMHALTFMVWLAGLLWRAPAAAGLGGAWLWLTRKLAHAPDQALIVPALINVLGQAGARRATLGVITHAWWTLVFVAVLLTLLTMLATVHYQFIWATTLLAPDRFVTLTRTLAALPAWLGFPSPAADMVRLSDGFTPLPPAVQSQWSLWLIGVVVAYGLLPRLAALTLCAAQVTRALRRLRVDPLLPGLDALRPRLLPDIASLGDDGIVPAIYQPHIGRRSKTAQAAPYDSLASSSMPVVAALEWPADAPWPFVMPDDSSPASPPSALTGAARPDSPIEAVGAASLKPILDAGRLDSRMQRRALLDALAARPALRLLLVCDAHMTPDRGVIGAVADFSRYARHTRVWLASALPNDTRPIRDAQWRDQLTQAGFDPDDVITGPDAAQTFIWLAGSSTNAPLDPSLDARGRP